MKSACIQLGPLRDEPRGEHVRGDAVRHGDPRRREVVGGPVALGDARGGEVFVEEARTCELNVCAQLDSTVGQFDLF